jgi:hypothetical protein
VQQWLIMQQQRTLQPTRARRILQRSARALLLLAMAQSATGYKPGGRLILVRHGQSTWNELNLFTGWADPPITLQGQGEAARAGALLRAHGVQGVLRTHHSASHLRG